MRSTSSFGPWEGDCEVPAAAAAGLAGHAANAGKAPEQAPPEDAAAAAADEVRRKGEAARRAARVLGRVSSAVKDRALIAMADALVEEQDRVLDANSQDLERAQGRLSGALLDRLTLNPKRIAEMAEGLRSLAGLPDPVGEVQRMWRRPNGLQIGQVRVPIGVVGVIYEARPNVTADAAGLCLKSGNAVLLRGGSEAAGSNQALVEVLAAAVERTGLPRESIQMVTTPGRESAVALMRARGLVDVLIPRGGAGLIRTVVEQASVPVIETGVGNCHVYVDQGADLEMAARIVINAKTQRPGVCNAMETLLVHRDVAPELLPSLAEELERRGVELRGCERTRALLPHVRPASEEDWATEYLALILAVRVVDGIDQAIEHISTYGTGHSEAIVTSDYARARRFTEEVDAACVYVNASTRFTDGFQFGFGAEVGISTQKLHARGPMGLEALTTIKYVVYGDGQVRT